jgi:hypothetical protein
MGFTSTFALLTSAPQSRVPVSHFLGSSTLGVPSTYSPSTSLSMSISMSMSAAPALADYTSAAMQFFTSVRTPAALIAGSSLGAFFIMVKTMSDPVQKRKSNVRANVLFLYRALTLTSLLLSLNVIVVTTSASNFLLIGDKINPMATSAYELLKREVFYEYVMTRWSFYASIICFLKAVGCRALIEFDLLKKERIRPAMLVIFSVWALIAHVLHIVNDCLYTYSNFWQMTLGMGKVSLGLCLSSSIIFFSLMNDKLYLERVWKQWSPMLLISFASALAALGTFVSLIPHMGDIVEEAGQANATEAE